MAALQDAPLHGYGIVRSIRGRSEGVLKLGEGQLYPILHRLEADGLITGEWEMQDGKPPRKLYSISESGRSALIERQQEWKTFSKAVGKVLGSTMQEARGNA